MQFRWIAFIALWTLLSGPIFVSPSKSSRSTDRAPTSTRPAGPSADGWRGPPRSRPK